MVTKFQITQELVNNNWVPAEGIVEHRTYQNIDHGGTDLGLNLKLNGNDITILCDVRTMKKEAETKDGFINQLFNGTCWLESNMIFQSKINVEFGDYPNGDATLTIKTGNNKPAYLDNATYSLKIIEQTK